ncbi:hypothetical protein L798_04330 [Zootermopsis nevadensis]|uniref:Uncharacterized protein n=1 Tax=Zootermopsis nevadensis TaxID=136037 RepID=A0A067RMU5_ZOONE|nr:hypothetical protein L798_04330 [Zootermopsis nevadensis]
MSWKTFTYRKYTHSKTIREGNFFYLNYNRDIRYLECTYQTPERQQ